MGIKGSQRGLRRKTEWPPMGYSLMDPSVPNVPAKQWRLGECYTGGMIFKSLELGISCKLGPFLIAPAAMYLYTYISTYICT